MERAANSEQWMRDALDPEEVWLSHEHEPWRPPVDQHV
jgi:hypothetical protein